MFSRLQEIAGKVEAAVDEHLKVPQSGELFVNLLALVLSLKSSLL